MNNKIYIDGKLYKSIHQTPKNGLTKLAVEIKNPRRWWPHNLGEPYLYTIKVLVFKVPIVIMTKILTMDCVFMTSIIKVFIPIFYLIPSLETHSISLSLGLTLVMMNMMNR